MALTLDKNYQSEIDEMKNAIESGDSEDFAKTVVENIIKNNEKLQKRFIQESENFNAENADVQVLVKRGFQPLTAEETKYYNEVQEKHSFEGIPMPRTIFERVFEDLEKNHPLLSKIDFINVTGTNEWILRTEDVEAAWWGKLCEEIKKKLDTAFEVVKTDLYKVSAYVPVCKAMLDLGPQWLDRYVRAILAESISLALEKAIVVGTGKDQPVGIFKKLEDVAEGEHQDKEAIELAEFTTKSIGKEILKPLRQGKTRPAGEIIMVVNDGDYYEHFFQVEYGQDRDGKFYEQKLPFNMTIVPTPYAPEGKMAVGEARNYFLGIGSTLKMDYSDEFRFLDDQRVYLAKQYATGQARKDEDFLVFDISGIKVYPETLVEIPEVPEVPGA